MSHNVTPFFTDQFIFRNVQEKGSSCYVYGHIQKIRFEKGKRKRHLKGPIYPFQGRGLC